MKIGTLIQKVVCKVAGHIGSLNKVLSVCLELPVVFKSAAFLYLLWTRTDIDKIIA